MGTLTATFSLTNTGPFGITIGALQNAASLADKIAAPNDIVAAFGSLPGCVSATVTVDGVPTTVFYSSPTQVNFLLPGSVAGETSATLQFACAGLTSQAIQIPVAPTSPGIFTAGESGTGQASIVNQNGGIATPTAEGTFIESIRDRLWSVQSAFRGRPAPARLHGDQPHWWKIRGGHQPPPSSR